MEIVPKDVGSSPKDQPEMTDADTAIRLIDETFLGASGRDVRQALGAAFDALQRHEKRLPKEVLQDDRRRSWTERRVRALWNREARRVDHYEIQDLTAIAVEEAKIERQRLKAREDRLAAFLAAHEAGLARQQGDQEGGRAVRLDLPRAGTDADEHADQSAGWGI
jgi:hypothetical protein